MVSALRDLLVPFQTSPHRDYYSVDLRSGTLGEFGR